MTDYQHDLALCLRSSPHLHTLAGLMQGRGVRVTMATAETEHGVPWGAIVVQGAAATGMVQDVARAVAEQLEREAQRLRDDAARG